MHLQLAVFFNISALRKQNQKETLLDYVLELSGSKRKAHGLSCTTFTNSLTKPDIRAKFEQNLWFEVYYLLPGCLMDILLSLSKLAVLTLAYISVFS